MMNQEYLESEYSKHVKESVRLNKKPMNPDDFINSLNAEPQKAPEVKNGGNGGFDDGGMPVKTGGNDDDERQNQEKVKDKFFEILWYSGYSKKLTLLEDARHFVVLLDPKRPQNQKPQKPCVLCSDLFCPWSE